MKRGQITLFLIVAVVLILIVGFFMTLASKVSEDVNVKDVVVTQEQITAVTSAMEDCLDKAASDGLELIGKQGGMIYKHQALDEELIPEFSPKGTPPNLPGYINAPYGFQVIPYQGYSVAYGLNKPDSYSGLRLDVPAYPFLGKLVPNYNLVVGFQKTFTDGRSSFQGSLPALCSTHGPNEAVGEYEDYTCETYSYLHSLQSDLTKFVTSNFTSCVKSLRETDYFKGIRLTVPSSKPEIKVFIGEKDVSFYAKYPISIGGGKIEIIQFTDRKNVRLKYIYEFITHLFKHEIKNIFFDMIDDSASVNDCKNPWPSPTFTNCKKNMIISRANDVCLNNNECLGQSKFADIYTVTDPSSILNGKDYNFSFAVENRRPALDLIHKQVSPVLAPYYDIVVSAGEKIVIDPYGYDPDNEYETNCVDYSGRKCMGRTYNYTGWKATYDENFTFNSATMDIIGIKLSDSNCIFSSPVSFYKYQDSSGNTIFPQHSCHTTSSSPYVNQWQSSCEYAGGNNCGNAETLATKRVASYNTTMDDVGPHEVNVSVRDSSGLFDYQLVRIMVLDSSGTGNNGYHDIEDNRASWEDDYTLKMKTAQSQGIRFTWNDNNSFSSQNDDVKLECSNGPPLDNYGTCKLKGELWSPSNNFPNVNYFMNTSAGNYEKSYLTYSPGNFIGEGLNPTDNDINKRISVNTSNGAKSYLEVYMHQCLPHKSSENTAPYPFNNWSYNSAYPDNHSRNDGIYWNDGFVNEPDPYQATHVCCQGIDEAVPSGTNPNPSNSGTWGTYQPSTKKCYELNKTYSYYQIKKVYGISGTSNNYKTTRTVPPAQFTGNGPDSKMKVNLLQGHNSDDEIYNNDILNRSFHRNCSGTTGNSCSGLFSDEATIIECNDKSGTEDESCQGPCVNCWKDMQSWNNVIVQKQCHNYGPGESFERSFMHHELAHQLGYYDALIQSYLDGTLDGTYDGSHDGICNPMPECSGASNTYNNGPGDFLNVGLCKKADGTCTAGVGIDCGDKEYYHYDANGQPTSTNIGDPILNKIAVFPGTCIVNPPNHNYLNQHDDCGANIHVENENILDLDEYEDLCKGAKDNNGDTKLACYGQGPPFIQNQPCWFQTLSTIEHGGYSQEEIMQTPSKYECCGDDSNETQAGGIGASGITGAEQKCCPENMRWDDGEGSCTSQYCVINSISLSNICGGDGVCSNGETIDITFNVEGCNHLAPDPENLPFGTIQLFGDYYIQLDGWAGDQDNPDCSIKFIEGDIDGLGDFETKSGNSFTVNAVFNNLEGKCSGKTIDNFVGAVWFNGNPGEGEMLSLSNTIQGNPYFEIQ